jgi:hypothetical protein
MMYQKRILNNIINLVAVYQTVDCQLLTFN